MELLLAALLRRAIACGGCGTIKDAQGKQESIREEAARWLWETAPGIAERTNVPTHCIASGNTFSCQ